MKNFSIVPDGFVPALPNARQQRSVSVELLTRPNTGDLYYARLGNHRITEASDLRVETSQVAYGVRVNGKAVLFVYESAAGVKYGYVDGDAPVRTQTKILPNRRKGVAVILEGRGIVAWA